MTIESKKITLPSPNIVLERIEKWRNLDLRNLDDSEIDDQLSDFLNSLGIYPVLTDKTTPTKLWRIRRLNYLFKEVTECWEPPSSKTRMNRCNAPGSPVLYLSENCETPFEELNVKPGEQVYAIQYKAVEEINLKQIVPKKFIATDLNNTEIYEPESMISYQILREFVRSEFLRPVGIGTEYLYKISSSMCRAWFDSDDSDGWRYPSIQTPSKDNIALKPAAARKKLGIIDVRIVRLVEKENTRNHLDKFRSHPFYNLISMVIETDFKGEINKDHLNWFPSTETLGII